METLHRTLAIGFIELLLFSQQVLQAVVLTAHLQVRVAQQSSLGLAHIAKLLLALPVFIVLSRD